MTRKLILLLTIFILSAASQAQADITHDLLDEKQKAQSDDVEVSLNEPSFFDKVRNIFSKETPKGNIVIYQYSQETSYPVNLRAAVSTVINLPENEKITFYSTGDSKLFKIKYDKEIPNFISIITLSNNAESNLVIKTDIGSIYNFFLNSNIDDESEKPNFTVYVIKDKDQEDAVKEKILLRDLQENNDYIKKIKSLDKLNTSYRIKGDKDIAPIFVYDDSKWTYFDFGKKFVSDRLPNAYKIVDEFDSVINTRVVGNLLIAQSLSVDGWTLKNGEKYVCIRPKKSLYEVYQDERYKQ